MPVRRITRAQARAEFWVGEIGRAENGDKALTDALRWLRKEISLVADLRPEAAEAARWDMARLIAGHASRLPRARITLRPGLTPDEKWKLLHPWKQQGSDPQ